MSKFQKFANILDFTEHVKNSPGSNKVITLRSFKKLKTITINPAKSTNGDWLGIKDPSLISREEKESGAYIPTPSSKRELKEAYSFDLSKEKDLADWDWVKYSRNIVLTAEDAKSNKDAEFYIEMPEYESKIKLTKFEVKAKALNLINSLDDVELGSVSAMLGNDLSHLVPSQIRSWILEFADDEQANAEKAIKVIEDPAYKTAILFLDARKKGIITKVDGMYRYGEVMLGFTEEVVKEFLRDNNNKKVVNSIIGQVKFGMKAGGEPKSMKNLAPENNKGSNFVKSASDEVLDKRLS